MMDRSEKIYVAGHSGLAGSALVRRLRDNGYHKLALRTHSELDLSDGAAVGAFFAEELPHYVFLAAGRVGGILANNSFPADFIFENLRIAINVIDQAFRYRVKRLLFLGSSCIYPKHAPQPMNENCLMTGPLEPTNRPYALAKLAGVEMCWAYNRQYGTRFLAAMPTNLYGPNDNYDLQRSHVVAALIRKFHEAKFARSGSVVVWGTGNPRREFLYSDDFADACLLLMKLPEQDFTRIVGSQGSPPVVNIGCGEDLTIRELAQLLAEVVGFDGRILFDPSKPDGTPRKLLDVTRLKALGWAPKTPIRDGLIRTCQDYCERYAEEVSDAVGEAGVFPSSAQEPHKPR